MRKDVVGDDKRAGLELRQRQLEQLLVVVLLGVEEDDVEDVVDCGDDLLRIALEQVGGVLEACFGDVAPPRVGPKLL